MRYRTTVPTNWCWWNYGIPNSGYVFWGCRMWGRMEKRERKVSMFLAIDYGHQKWLNPLSHQSQSDINIISGMWCKYGICIIFYFISGVWKSVQTKKIIYPQTSKDLTASPRRSKRSYYYYYLIINTTILRTPITLKKNSNPTIRLLP